MAGNALAKPVTPTGPLAEVIGAAARPRTQVVADVWTYIRDNKLQNPADKRQIIADARLKAVFGGKDSVSMFELTKLVSGFLKG